MHIVVQDVSGSGSVRVYSVSCALVKFLSVDNNRGACTSNRYALHLRVSCSPSFFFVCYVRSTPSGILTSSHALRRYQTPPALLRLTLVYSFTCAHHDGVHKVGASSKISSSFSILEMGM